MNEMIPDIPRIITAFAEWLACVVQISLMNKRIKGWRLYVLSGVWLMIQMAFLVLTDDVPNAFWLLCMLSAVGLMLAFLVFSCRERMIDLVCACIKAFLLAEFVASLEWQIHCFFLSHTEAHNVVYILVFLVTYGAVFALAYLLEKKVHQDSRRKRTANEMGWLLLIAGVSFLFSNISFSSIISPFSGTVTTDIFYIRTLVDFGGLAILYAYEGHLNEFYIREELANIDRLYKSQYDNFMRFQENMDVINIKYHDLKHQISALRSRISTESQVGWLDDLEKEIEENHIFLNTGNQMLDTILSEKILLCKKERIEITCMADGSLLSFMQAADICSVFGNALDNAIESVCSIQDANKRLIHVSVTLNRGCVLILIKNYVEQIKSINSNMLSIKSSKPDKEYHGYGLKSIHRTVERYGGTCSVAVEDHWFYLRILFDSDVITSEAK